MPIGVNINASKQTWASSGNETTWSAARDATSSSSNVTYTSQSSRGDAMEVSYSSGRGGGTYVIGGRSFFFFDTSTVVGTITAISLKLYGYLNGGNRVIVAKSTAFGNNGSAYANSDFNNWTTLGLGGAPVPYSSNLTWSAGATNTITLNATAVSDANSNSYLNLVVLDELYDYPNISPTVDVTASSGITYASSIQYPQLAITYTASGYGNDVNGVASANIASVNGVATANIASINSVT